MYKGKKESNNYEAQILLEEETEVYGEVYCNKNTEIRGAVYGTVYTDQFVAHQFSSIYMNHLYNCTINIEKVPRAYTGLVLSNRKKDIVKCLY